MLYQLELVNGAIVEVSTMKIVSEAGKVFFSLSPSPKKQESRNCRYGIRLIDWCGLMLGTHKIGENEVVDGTESGSRDIDTPHFPSFDRHRKRTL